MAGDWRMSADERMRYEAYFQQCGPVQGYLTGEQARDFFVKSGLPGDILRKIWDLADITTDGRLDKREFAIACYLIAFQVQKKGPLPSTLPPSLLSDTTVMTTVDAPAANKPVGRPNISNQHLTGQIAKPTGATSASPIAITPANRSKYLQQFHSLPEGIKTGGYITGLQAKNILLQTGLAHALLHQIWNLADYDKDGRLSGDEFVIAMHCCDIARAGLPLPPQLPEDWLQISAMQRERADTSSKSIENQTYANLNQQLQETITTVNTPEPTPANPSAELEEVERKSALITYEEKRLKNYEDGNRELERRRQLLREQEEREQKERDERERKRELELQKHREEQERKKQMEIERQLEKQRQIEHQKEEERKKLHEQREAARKELERKNRLEWERQRMQELSSQKSRLLEQINDLKSREKAFGLEVESMDDTMQTCQTKINQLEINIHSFDETIADIQQNIIAERNLFENIEQQKKELLAQLNTIQVERESLDSSVNQLIQSKEFSNGNREQDQIHYLRSQNEAMNEEYTAIDELMSVANDQCKDLQNQMEQLRLQLEQLEQEAREKKPPSKVASPTNPPAEFAKFDQFNADIPSEDINMQSSDVSSSLPAVISAATEAEGEGEAEATTTTAAAAAVAATTTLNDNDVIFIDENQRKKRTNISIDPQSTNSSTNHRPIKRARLKPVDDVSPLPTQPKLSETTSSHHFPTIPQPTTLTLPYYVHSDSQQATSSIPSSYSIDLNNLKTTGMNIIFTPTTTESSNPSNSPLVLTLGNFPYQPT